MRARTAMLIAALVVAVTSLWLVFAASDPPPTDAAPAATSARNGLEAARPSDSVRPADAPASIEPDLLARFGEAFAPDDPAWAWARVDLDALREEMPDNAFWELAAPTDDPNVLDERRARRDEENREWGRILSNTAPEADIRAFYSDRQRVSTDLVTFTTRLLDDYGAVLPDRDRGLVELSRRMHRQRLEELPRRLQEALDRREAHAAVVEAWRAEQALFDEGSDSAN